MKTMEAIKTIRRGLSEHFGNDEGMLGPYVVIYGGGDASEIVDARGHIVSGRDKATAEKLGGVKTN